jgi:hypothetical protein
MGESGKLGSQEHEMLRAIYMARRHCLRRMESGFNLKQLLKKLINMVALFIKLKCTMGWSAMHLKGAGAKHARTIPRHDLKCLQQERYLITLMLQKNAPTPPTCDSYYILECGHLEVFFRKLMATHYCQTAAWLLPASSEFVLKNSVLQVYNIAIHGYDISHHS